MQVSWNAAVSSLPYHIQLLSFIISLSATVSTQYLHLYRIANVNNWIETGGMAQVLEHVPAC
jgi:hypothetical protein